MRAIEAKEKQKEPGVKMAEGGPELRVGGAVGANQADFGF